jgi:hypothetical protein
MFSSYSVFDDMRVALERDDLVSIKRRLDVFKQAEFVDSRQIEISIYARLVSVNVDIRKFFEQHHRLFYMYFSDGYVSYFIDIAINYDQLVELGNFMKLEGRIGQFHVLEMDERAIPEYEEIQL